MVHWFCLSVHLVTSLLILIENTGYGIMSVSHTPNQALLRILSNVGVGAAPLVQHYLVFSARPGLGYGTLIQCDPFYPAVPTDKWVFSPNCTSLCLHFHLIWVLQNETQATGACISTVCWTNKGSLTIPFLTKGHMRSYGQNLPVAQQTRSVKHFRGYCAQNNRVEM